MSQTKNTFGLDDDDFRVDLLRVVCSVGEACSSHLEELHYYSASDVEGRDWKSIIGSISAKLVEDAFLPTHHYPTLLGRARQHVTMAAEIETGPLADTLAAVAKDTTALDDARIMERLLALNQRGHSLASGTVEEWGTDRVVARWSSCELAPLAYRFAAHPDSPLSLETRNGETITVVLGWSPGVLLTYMSLAFYFMHEYVSHILPNWDDDVGTFSEGFLYQTAWRSFSRQTKGVRDAATVEEDREYWESRRQKRLEENNVPRDPWREARQAEAWLFSQCRDQATIPGLLLDLAAYPSKDQVAFHSHCLNLIRRTADENRQDLARTILCMASPDIERAFSALHAAFPVP